MGHTKTLSFNGREMVLETGILARQANASVTLRCGDTILLTTVCSTKKPADEIDFLPLRVDYQEKFSSTGKTLGGFIKREGKPSEREILISRLIDRPIRPMIEEGYYQEIQVLTYVLSYDGVHAPDPLAICAASAALCLSDVPLVKPIAAVRVGYIGERFVVNPPVEEMKQSRLDLILAGTHDAILMIEGYADFLTEEQILEAIDEGHQAIKTICEGLSDWQLEIGKEKDRDHLRLPDVELLQSMETLIKEKAKKAIRLQVKKEREEALAELSTLVFETYLPKDKEPQYSKVDITQAFDKIVSSAMRQMILEENIRCDGRHSGQIRPIDIRVGILPRTHGCALFTRGETQSLAVCTLGSENMAQRFEDLHGENANRFYLQYFFPPFSVGEVGRMGAPGRREIGHGKLAERSLLMTLPPQEKFPYVIRLESNITESNGSSSMASVCGGTLALMDAGVPIKAPIAGIAMGLILDGKRYAILSDILGAEDALGDMDFKIAGDANGITAFQLDIKIEGITRHIMESALLQAKEGRLHILSKMIEACPKSKEQLSIYAPRIETLQVKPSKIGTIIGPGGKQIRSIIETTGVQIDIDDNGIVSIASNNQEAMEKAKAIIMGLVAEIEKGKVYHAKAISIVPNVGVVMDIGSGKEGFCHISEIEHRRLRTIEEVIKVGDSFDVMVIEITDRGQVRVSRKALIPPPPKPIAQPSTIPVPPIVQK